MNDKYERATFLNALKHQVRTVTKTLDTALCVFEPSLETTEVSHEVSILLSELAVHGLSSETDTLTPQMYQKQALRTLYPDLNTNERLGLCGLGLSGEIGEVTDIIKKHLYHRNGKPLDIASLKAELGDVLWYFAVLCSTLGVTIEEVMVANIAKMQARHPDGFHPHYTSDSGASL